MTQANEDFKLLDTYALQIKSLCAFAYQLGYTPNSKWQFEAIDGKGLKGCHIIDFNTMVELHNWGFYQWQVRGMLNQYQLNKVKAYKVVKEVYLQRKHPGIVTCHKHLVKFVDPAYEALFL